MIPTSHTNLKEPFELVAGLGGMAPLQRCYDGARVPHVLVSIEQPVERFTAVTWDQRRFRRLEAKVSTVSAQFPRRCGEFGSDCHDSVGPPSGRWQAPDVGGVINGKRCAKEEVVVVGAAGDACPV